MTVRVRFGFTECVLSEIVLTALIVLFTILQIPLMITICFALSFIVLLVYTMRRVKEDRFDIYVLMLIVLSVLNVVINALLSSGVFYGFDYFKKVIMFVSFILLLYYSCEDKAEEMASEKALYITYLTGVLLVLSYQIGGNHATYAGGITLGFTNPNFTGMWLLHFAIYTFLMLVYPKSRLIVRTISLILMLVIAWLIGLTKARSCLLGFTVFLILCLLGRLTNYRLVQNRVFQLVVVVFPIMIVMLYQFLLESSWFMRAFSFLVTEGKGLNSRVAVWAPAIEYWKKSVILGDYCGISGGTGLSQMHNTHLDVLCSYGLVPFILFSKVLFSCISKTASRSLDSFRYCALCGFVSVLIMGSFEAAIVAGAMGMNILTAGLLILANTEWSYDK